MATDEQARLQSIIDTAVDAIITIDERGEIESVNPAAERMFGHQASEAIGQNVRILMPSPYGEEHDGYLARFVKTGEAHIIGVGREVTGRRKDGSTFPIRLSVGEFWLGDQRRFTGIVHDLTEQKRAEERALQAERLAAMGQMMTVLTHESRNLLQIIQSNLEMLEPEIEDRREALDYLARVQRAQDKLARLYRELREFAAPVHLDCEPYHLGHLVGEVINELSTVHADKQIRLLDHANGSDLTCAVDPFRMHQVFRNVLENSIAASPDPVQIAVVWSHAEWNDHPAVQVTFRDNGPGLSPEDKPNVFEPFFTTKRGGTGLGLAITRRIVEAHGGHIAAGGNGHGGAEFVITLPRGLSNEQTPTHVPSVKTHHHVEVSQ